MSSPSSSSSASSSSSSSLHPASLVSPTEHSPALLQMTDLSMSRPIVDYAVDLTIETVDYAMGRPSYAVRGRRTPQQAKFAAFANTVLTRAEVSTPTLIGTLAYIDRARPHLHIALEEWALERVFLGALIVASKYLNDSTLKNVHWAMCTSVFGKRDIGRIEREFLDVLDWELGLSEGDLLDHHDGLVQAVVSSSSPKSPHHSTMAFPPSHRPFKNSPHHHKQRSSTTVAASSPSSSVSSCSTLDSPKTPFDLPHHRQRQPQKPQRSHEQPHHHPSHQQHQTVDLLKSFPIPLPLPSSVHHHHTQQPVMVSV